ncbi:MAG: hypothetical protein MUP41_19290, partial [Desulfobacterales bacterium]|nr:hypothetical protein [Desulfobacterales bacterium]
GHMAVAFPVTGGELTIMDPAGHYFTKNSYGNLDSKEIHTTVSEWLAYWSKNYPGLFVNQIFSDAEYQQFSNTAEFENWAKNR